MASKSNQGKRSTRISEPPLAAYTDPAGRKHRIVRRGRLVLDLCATGLPRVVVELTPDEGHDQVGVVLQGANGDEGYLARMGREDGPLCRVLTVDDVRSPAPAEGDDERPAKREMWRAA